MSDKPSASAARKAAGRKSRTGQTEDQTTPVATVPAAASGEQGPPEGVKALALDYPFALLAGGLAVGVLIGALLPRRRAARLSGPLAAAAGVISEAGLGYARRALERAATTGHDAVAGSRRLIAAAGDQGEHSIEAAADQGAELAGKAANTVKAAAETAPGAIMDSGRRIARSVVRLTSQLRH